jgi:hypothetical protein
MANGDQQFIDRCKLDLGDAYLWNLNRGKLLIYSWKKSKWWFHWVKWCKTPKCKVSVFFRETLNYQKKFRYFETSNNREIANDAMELGFYQLWKNT